MKILFAAFEISPFTKVGGLADVMGSLPKYLEELNCDIAMFAPLIGSIDLEKCEVSDIPNSKIKLKFGISEYFFELKVAKLPGSKNINVFFIDNKKYFSCFKQVYPPQIDDRYEQERYIAFSRAVLEYAKLLNFKPDIIHCNDWHTAMIPIYLKTNFKNDEFFKNIKSVFSIHNLAYQGKYFDDILDFAQLNKEDVYTPECLEHFGYLDWMKGAIYSSDKIITVSPTYAKEILTYEYGEGLDWPLKENRYKLTGILNGVDYSVFNPEIDKRIAANYSLEDKQNKAICNNELREYFSLPKDDKPIIGIVSRLVEQKGFDLFFELEKEIQNLHAYIVVLGTGDKKYEAFFKKLSEKYKNIKALLEYKVEISNKIYAGSDMFLMPSRFEPCGLSQLIALKYGTIPIVRATGGLEDTINGYPLENSNGFKFWRFKQEDMLEAINIAINVFYDKDTWNSMINSAMSYDYSWNESAKKYLDVYNKLCS